MLRKSTTIKPDTSTIRSVGYSIQKQKFSTKNLNLKEQEIIEWIKCRNNPIYFIYNYVKFETIGNISSYKESTNGYPNFSPVYKRFIRSLFKYNKTQLMATRQLGKSTISAAYLAWVQVFFANNFAIILNMMKDAALKNISTVRFMNQELPDFMRLDLKSKSEIKSYIEFSNGSKIKAFYPSTVHAKSTIARSLTSAILYIDEAAHITDMREIFGLI